MAEAGEVDMARRSSFRINAWYPLLRNDHFRSPLAILFNNQGLVKTEFRAGLALVRVVESTVTAAVYYKLGLFAEESISTLSVLAPSVIVGIPLGALLIRGLNAETFRRICMSFDAWVVGFGLSRVLIELSLLSSPWAYSVMVITILIDLYLLYTFFTARSATPLPQLPNSVPSLADDGQGLKILVLLTTCESCVAR